MDNFDSHFKAIGPDASHLRRRKYELGRRHSLPTGMVPGSLTQTARRCGKPTCRCASGAGHPIWIFSFTVAGQKHTEVIPKRWVPLLRTLLEVSQVHRQALAEVLQVNAKLFQLWRQQERTRSAKRRAS